MNRLMKRQQGIKVKERIYTLKESDLTKLIATELDAIKKQATKAAINALMSSVLISLHDEFGFGVSRLNKLIHKINSQYEAIESGNVNIEDFNEWAKEKGFKYGQS